MVGVAVKVTLVPAHIVVADAPILTLTGKFGLTVMVIPADVAGFPVTHIALEVSTTVITSPLTKVVEEKVEAVAPAIFTPFNFH